MALGKKFEDSRLGQLIITVAMGVVIVAVLLWNLPAGRARDKASTVVSPIVQAIGLEQNWLLFAPNPRTFSVGVYATVYYADGSHTIIVPPHNGVFFSPYANYRWQKYVEQLRANDEPGLYEPAARYFAREAGGHPVSVTLTRTFQAVKVPGASGARPPDQSFVFYTLQLS